MIKNEYRYEYSKIEVTDFDAGDHTHLTGRFSNGHVDAEFTAIYDTETGELSLELDSIYMVLIDQDGGELRSYEGDQVDLTQKQVENLEYEAKEKWYKTR